MNAALEISAAKLRTPRIGPDLVARARLERLLNRGLNSVLTLVSAPAGFGKTTLLTEWLAAASLPAAWLSLDDDDSDLTVFTQYLILAIRTVFPDACQTTLGLLRSPQALKPTALATHLANEVNDLAAPLVVVLDDYHAISDSAVHQMMAALLDQLPPTVHFVILTRVDPPLPLARLRARGHMTDVRADDLRFSSAEIAQFFEKTDVAPLDAAALTALETRTEGWAAGLRLASLSLQAGLDTASLTHGLEPRAARYIMDYLLDEVLSKQPQAVQDFLLATSVLDAFNAPLAAALRENGDISACEALIEEIGRANLFLVVLDETRGWYRYHHLFRDLLNHKLTQMWTGREIADLHLRACGWFIAHGAIGEAVHHSLAAGDEDRAARLVEGGVHGAALQDNRLAIKRWLDMLPPQLVERRPGLLLARCWVLASRDSQDALAPLLEQAQALLEQPDVETSDTKRRALWGDLNLFWAQYWVYTLQGPAALAAAQRAVDNIPPQHAYARGYATLYRAMALQMVGRTDEALASLEEPLRSHPSMPFAQKTMLYTGLMIVNFAAGDLSRAAEAARAALPRPDERERYRHMVSHLYPVLGHIYYEMNDLDTAIATCQACPTFAQSGHLWGEYESGVSLTLCYAARGQLQQAQQTLDNLLALVRQFADPALQDEAHGLSARLALIAGDLPSALAWAAAPALKQKGLLRLEAADITRSRILVASDMPENARRALDVLREPMAAAQTSHSAWRLALLLALKALALQTLGETDAAVEAMSSSVRIAAPYGYVRTYLDLGPRAAGLLHRLAQQGVEIDYIGRLLLLFPQTSQCAVKALSSVSVRSEDLIEPLTIRESQVLAMLARRLSDKEIAEALVISPLTARSHIAHIFGKLGVKNRRSAVERARSLGLLDPH